MNNSSVDSYLVDGCGRCSKYRTPDCKVLLWTDALETLRAMLSETELTETMKWGTPCYTLGGKNVVMVASFRDHCRLVFFKGIVLVDEDGVLESAGPNSRIVRVVRYRSVEDVEELRAQTERLIEQAIEAERAGVKVPERSEVEELPLELELELEANDELRDAFELLTPGRRRSHILHVSGGKQSATRARRVERCAVKIMAGKGFNER